MQCNIQKGKKRKRKNASCSIPFCILKNRTKQKTKRYGDEKGCPNLYCSGMCYYVPAIVGTLSFGLFSLVSGMVSKVLLMEA
jgi:hypothetical protein